MNKLTVTVGIPAFNEERNILRLIHAVLEQESDTFLLEEIIIIADGCTDRTTNLVKTISDKRLKLVENRKRIGQSASQNMLFAMSTSDVLILLEADTLPSSIRYLALLLKPIIKNNELALVQGFPIPARSTTYLGKVLSQHYRVLYACFSENRISSLAICSGRGGRAMSKDFYQNIKIPTSVPEDVYMLLISKKQGKKTALAKTAEMMFTPPQTLRDYLKAEGKQQSAKKALLNHFDAPTINNHFYFTIINRLRYILQTLSLNPINFFTYVTLRVFAYFMTRTIIFDDFWQIGQSTKSVLAYEYEIKK